MNITSKQVLEYVANSETINRAIKNIIRDQCPELISDFRSFFFLEVASMSEEKLVQAYNEGWIDGLCIKTIVFQLKSATSKFYREYRRDWKGVSVKKTEMTDDMFGIMTDPNFTDMLHSYKGRQQPEFTVSQGDEDRDRGTSTYSDEMMDTFVYSELEEEERTDYERNQERKLRAQRTVDIVNELYPYDREMWTEFFINHKSYQTISDETGIKCPSIYDNIMKTNRYVIGRYRELYGLNSKQEKYIKGAKRLQPKKKKQK